MIRQLPADCLNEIFECYLNDNSMKILQRSENIATLRSCLLVNRLWCKISVRILWTDVQNYNTLIACLPNESKEILYKNEIVISSPTLRPPLFNYVTFVKTLLMDEIYYGITHFLKNHQYINSDDDMKNMLVMQEIYKMFMNQTTLKTMTFYTPPSYFDHYIPNIPLTTYPGAIDCLRNLSELTYNSINHYEFFHQLSKICFNLQSLKIIIDEFFFDGLVDLISVQQSLKYLSVFSYYSYYSGNHWLKIIPSIEKLPNNLIKLCIGGEEHTPLSFIAKFTNLQELVLSLWYIDEEFKTLQYVTFPRLQILRFTDRSPNHEYLIKFLEINGKGLKEIHLNPLSHLSILAIAKFCPNLKLLYTIFKKDEVETLKVILNSCQELECIRVMCGDGYLNECELLEVVTKYSPKKFHELKIFWSFFSRSVSFTKELEPIFITWSNCIPQKPLSLIIVDYQIGLKVKKESMEVIEKFKKLDIIRKFEISVGSVLARLS